MTKARLLKILRDSPEGQAAARARADERRRIRRDLLAVGVIKEGYWAVRSSVISAILAVTRAPRRGRR